MNQRTGWLVILGILLAAIGLEFRPVAGGVFVLPYILAGITALWLPTRPFLRTVLLIGLCCLVPLVFHADDGSQWINRVGACMCLAAIALVRFGSDTWNRLSQPLDGETLFGVESFDLEEDLGSVDDSGLVAVDGADTEHLEFSVDAIHPSHQTRVHETDHHANREAGQFALDAGATRNYVEPALERLQASGQFNDAQMKLIANEMRVLEERGLVAEFVACLTSGTQVGRFIIEEPLGRGGEGNVYRGHDDSGQPGAIKILHNMRVSDRFRREMHVVRQLAHPNIVTAYEVGEFRGLPFITMELLRGPDLYIRVKENGPINWQQATHYILQAARALAHAHQRNLIHRDVKPGNMILNNGESIKLVDFGLAAQGALPSVTNDSVFRYRTEDGHLAGTLPFMAPEQARSLANANVRSDIYGLGATWFYLLTGRERLRGKTFSQQFENLLVRRRFNALSESCMPPELIAIYRRMVAYNSDERFESCEVVCHEMEKALTEAGKLVIPDEINVLVIEDSRTDMLFTLEMLRRSNSTLNVHQARSLSSGLDVCESLDVGLALLDLTLPDSVGVNTVQRFRSAVPHVPLVVLTGMAEEAVGGDCLAAGADSFVSKHGLTAHRMERTIFVTLSRHNGPPPNDGGSDG
ncbi:MAG: protein kinase [Planctomycetota bacterium]